MFCDFNKIFSKLNNYTKIKCRECDNVNKCLKNENIFLYKDGTYQPLHSYNYHEDYGCSKLKKEL